MPQPPGTKGELDVVVIGAGISGLLAAKQLAAAGHRVGIFERARGPGGRMASRRFGNAIFDHGAQYFTAREPAFRALVEEWLEARLIHLWSDGFAVEDGTLNQNGEPRYAGTEGMITVPKHLAEPLTVYYGATAESCSWSEGSWSVTFKERPPATARVVILTAPVPQSLEVLAAGATELDSRTTEALARITYTPCLAALIRLTGASKVPKPGGLWLNGEPVSWVADNTQKGISPPVLGASVTIHAGPVFSREHWGTDPDETAGRLAGHVRKWLGTDIAATQVHRWRFATPVVVHPKRVLTTTAPGPLAFAGDAFGGPRVEGAALSGMAAAEAVAGMLK